MYYEGGVMEKIFEHKIFRFFVIFACILIPVVIISSFIKTDDKASSPENGVLDLKEWPATDKVHIVDGEWNFYWNHLLTFDEIVTHNSKPDLIVKVPSVWNKYKVNGKKLPAFGYGTYQIEVVNATVGEPLAIQMPTFLSSYALYIDDQFVSACGKVSTNKEEYSPGCKSQEVEFTPTKDSFQIIIQVSNYSYAQGGMYFSIKMGKEEEIKLHNKRVADIDLFLFGALTIMGFYYLCNFLMRREDKSSLYVVVISFLYAIITSIQGDFLIYRLIPFISYEAIMKIYYIGISWSSVVFAIIINDLFPQENSKKVINIALIYSTVITLIVLLTPVSIYSHLLIITQGYTILLGTYCTVSLAWSYIRRREDALMIFLAAIINIICAAHDMVFKSNASKIGTMVMLVVQSYVLAKRFSVANRNINAMASKLLTLDKVKDEFLANTSHELRTPLSGILGITEAMLKGSEGELSSGQRQNLSIIAASSRRLSNLVNDIVDYSKMKNGNLNLYFQPLRIDGLIYTILNIFKQLNVTKECSILSEIQDDLPFVWGDENRIIQILYNLIGNAVKFTSKGLVKISVIKKADVLEICVSDTGEGIPKDKLETIFMSFEQVDSSITRRYSGAGLGLSITKHLVELQKGTIWVESQLGQGSRFYFTLPLFHGEIDEFNKEKYELESSELYSSEIPVVLEQINGDIRILVVDDDMVNLQAATALLKLEGYGVTAVNNGLAALGLLKNNSDYSLVILDVMMPEMSGYEFCKLLREDVMNYELPVLMLTAKSSINDIVLGFEAGANDYLSKPFEPEELMARVRTLTDLKRSVDRAIAAEVAFMQAQIKPHFLFNTLNTISSFCDTNPELAQELIDNFSDYLRESFDFKVIELYKPIEREIKLTKSYLEIEKARFGPELKVVFDVDTTINVEIPTLSIQPLVENAIAHGIRKKGGVGTVTIRVKKVKEGIRIEVVDDGPGISPEKLEGILRNETNSGIGLWNIDRRLKKLQGKGLTIESIENKGTKVSYIINPKTS